MVERIKIQAVSVMVFAIIKNQHHDVESAQGVRVVEVEDFEALAEYGWDADRWYAKGKFGDEGGRRFQPLREMRIGTVLKKGNGEYITRLA